MAGGSGQNKEPKAQAAQRGNTTLLWVLRCWKASLTPREGVVVERHLPQLLRQLQVLGQLARQLVVVPAFPNGRVIVRTCGGSLFVSRYCRQSKKFFFKSIRALKMMDIRATEEGKRWEKLTSELLRSQCFYLQAEHLERGGQPVAAGQGPGQLVVIQPASQANPTQELQCVCTARAALQAAAARTQSPVAGAAARSTSQRQVLVCCKRGAPYSPQLLQRVRELPLLRDGSFQVVRGQVLGKGSRNGRRLSPQQARRAARTRPPA